jgi:phosphoglycolate phosphatase-like HAD superfamily hydrolase
MNILFFDIDGTLIDSGGAGKLAMETAMHTEFGMSAPTEGVPYAGRTDRAIIADLLRYHALEASAGNVERLLRSYLGHLPQCLTQRHGHALRGVRELLDALHGREDVVLAVLTGNVEAGAANKLAYFNLAHYFPWGGYADEWVERNDVAHAARLRAERHLGHAIDERITLWVIGDTPHDVTCGRAIGAKVVAVATGSHTVDQLQLSAPDHVVPDLTDTAALLNRWVK